MVRQFETRNEWFILTLTKLLVEVIVKNLSSGFVEEFVSLGFLEVEYDHGIWFVI